MGTVETFHSIVLGLIQGLTEFLPISSSGHLIILRWLLGWKEHGILFDVILHAGPLCALLIYFRRDWISILRPGQTRLFWNLLVASIPAVIFAGIVAGRIEHYFRNPMSVALMLGVFGLLLYIADLCGRKDKSMAEMTCQL